MGEGDDDPDREAILARRRKLIAVALAGLTGAAGCGDDAARPTACLEMVTPTGEHGGTEEGASGQGASEEGSSETNEESENARPRVCLRRAVRPPPQPCLDVPAPREPADDEADDTDG